MNKSSLNHLFFHEMRALLVLLFLFVINIQNNTCLSQNEKTKWYFGNKAGLDFMTNPPTALSNGTLNTSEGCVSLADASGNLLFYSDGATVWNRLHQVMANGTGLLGNGPQGTAQAALAFQKPENKNLYYLFTLDDASGPNGLRYSITDMTLAAGNGSVITKNALVYAPSSEKMAGVRHCNGKDWWLITHESTGNVFRTYLLTANGLSVTPVLSSTGALFSSTAWFGYLKVSPSGKKLAMSSGVPLNMFEIFDFDNSTGNISAAMTLTLDVLSAAGCEFSPDGTKLYTTRWNGAPLYQWDLCAGNQQAVQSSCYTLTPSSTYGKGGLQLGPDNKLYVAFWNSSVIGVVNNPNAAGAACGYTETGQSLSPNNCNTTLPSFPIDFPSPLALQAGISASATSCFQYDFSSPPSIASSTNVCAIPITSLSSQSWDFGDPASGTLNVSSSALPSHTYSTPGTYTISLVLYYACGRLNDTLHKTITIVSPVLNITGKTSICAGQTTTLTAVGVSNYTWSTGQVSTTVAISPTLTTSYSVIGTSTLGGCNVSKVFTISVASCTGLSEQTKDKLRIFPNPSNGLLTIESEFACNAVVYNELGCEIEQFQIQRGFNYVELKNREQGTRFIKLNTPDGNQVIRLFVSP